MSAHTLAFVGFALNRVLQVLRKLKIPNYAHLTSSAAADAYIYASLSLDKNQELRSFYYKVLAAAANPR